MAIKTLVTQTWALGVPTSRAMEDGRWQPIRGRRRLRRLCVVTHYSRLGAVVTDVQPGDHGRELAFWQAATGQPLTRFDQHPDYHGGAFPGGVTWLLVQRLGEGQGRVHVDIHTDDLAAEVARLEELGAQRVRQVHSWWVMRDPAGLTFCVVPDPADTLNDDNAQRWD